MFGIEGRYATALYSAASKQKQLDSVEKDLKDVQALLKKKGRFHDYVMNPSLKRTDKRDLLSSALVESKASKLMANLVGTLVILVASFLMIVYIFAKVYTNLFVSFLLILSISTL